MEKIEIDVFNKMKKNVVFEIDSTVEKRSEEIMRGLSQKTFELAQRREYQEIQSNRIAREFVTTTNL